jgi:hypothetical protein
MAAKEQKMPYDGIGGVLTTRGAGGNKMDI